MNRWKWRSCSPHKKKQTLVFFCMHAARTGSKAVVVIAEDTDGMLLYLAFQNDIHCPIYQTCGTQNRTRFVDFSKLTWSLGDSVCDSQIGLHAFTGYDTVSAFASRGKLSSLKLMKRDITYQETFSQVGQTWNVQPQLFETGLNLFPFRTKDIAGTIHLSHEYGC